MGLNLARDLRAHFVMRTKFLIWWVNFFLMKIENFCLKGIIEKFVSCFFVQPFCGSFILFFKDKKALPDEGFKLLYKTLQKTYSLYTTKE